MKEESVANIINLNRSLQQKDSEIELLQQTFTEIGSELNLDKIFQIVSDRALKLINAETLIIPLIDDNRQTYTYRGGAGINVDEIIGESLPLGFGACGWVWRHKKPWWQGMLDELSEEEKNSWGRKVGNKILVPLQGKKHFLGGIAGLGKKGGGSFNKKDLNLLQLFASIVSIAIENAMAVKSMKLSHALNEDYRQRLEILNKQLIDSGKELEYRSLYDSVTSLPNRSLFYDRLTRDLKQATRSDSTVGILLIDLDNFKDINEVFGHDGGDKLLNKIARRLENIIKNNETLARLGGDEFIVILPGYKLKKVIKCAEKIIDSMKTAFEIQQQNIVISASIGIAVYPEHGDAISGLLSHADFAMYEAKSNNIDVCVYNPDTDHLSQGHLAMVADVRYALDAKQFELHYQPKVNVKSGQIVAVEALGRWSCQKHGDVPPNIFIKILEQNSLIDEYTYWAIETVLVQVKKWKGTFSTSIKRVAVNVSPQTLMHPDFKNNIDQVVKDKSDGELLTFEITENLFLSEFDRLSDVLEHICSLGIELSIDDYGTGYSSLSRLLRLPVNELKIDQSFIKEMVENKDDRAVVRSTIDLAHNLGLSVVAEGVENKAVLDILIKLGCDTVQGYLISKPLRIEEFNAFMKMQYL